jgi:hypothetical protein
MDPQSPLRLSNIRRYRPLFVTSGILLLAAACLALVVYSSDYFATAESASAAQVIFSGLILFGFGLLFYALSRPDLWVEFGGRIQTSNAFSATVFDWTEVESIALQKVEVTHALRGAPEYVNELFDLGPIHLEFRRVCAQFSRGRKIHCEIRVREWDTLQELARKHSIPVQE